MVYKRIRPNDKQKHTESMKDRIEKAVRRTWGQIAPDTEYCMSVVNTKVTLEIACEITSSDMIMTHGNDDDAAEVFKAMPYSEMVAIKRAALKDYF